MAVRRSARVSALFGHWERKLSLIFAFWGGERSIEELLICGLHSEVQFVHIGEDICKYFQEFQSIINADQNLM